MKKILLTITISFVALLTMAQSPNLMNYQGVARNAVGNVLPNQSISLRLSILNGNGGPVVYSETRTMLTNAFGLFNVVVGSPGFTSQTGTIAGINWTAFGAGSGPKYLQVEIDPNGGSSFTNVGSTQMVSVPYALNANAAAPVGPAGGDLAGSYPNPTIAFPLIKTFSFPTTQLIGMTNSATTGTLGAITGASASNDNNSAAITGTSSSTTPGTLSAGVKGVSNSTGVNGIGVMGTQAGGGIGVYGTTPSGYGVYGQTTGGTGAGVYGLSTTGVGVWGGSNTNNAGQFVNSNAANTADALAATSNGAGNAVSGINTGTGRGGFFQVNNALSNANALEVTTNGIGPSWGIRANSTGTNGAGLFVQTNATNTANNIQSNQGGLGRAGLFQTTNTANTADALTATSISTSTIPAAVHGINGGSGVTVAAKKGDWGESDNGVGVFGTSSTGIGMYGVGGSGTSIGVQALTFGTGPAFTGTSLGGRVADFTIATGNNSNVINAATAGNGMAINATTSGAGVDATFANTNAANISNTVRVLNANVSNTGFGNNSVYIERGTPSPFNNYLFTGVPTALSGLTDAGIGLQGSSASVYAVAGLTNTGVGLVGYAVNAAGYGIQTVGRLQFAGQGAATNNILGAVNAAGDATWRTPASLGLVSGSGTLNYVPKWTPNGTTLGNSLLFDNGTAMGINNVTPNATFDVVNNSATVRGAYVTNTSTTNGSSALLVQNNTTTGAGSIEGSAISAFLNPFAVGTITSTLNTPVAIKGFASTSNVVGAAGGTGVMGSSSGGFGVVGLVNNGTALWGLSLGGGYALQTDGKVQISGQGAGAGLILTSDAVGNATWKPNAAGAKFSSAWVSPFDPPSRDTSIDGTLTKVYYILAPELTPAVIASGQISVYFRVGTIGPYELPYISNAGGRANAIQHILMPGKIAITRPTFNEVAPNNINLPATLEFRYTIVQ